MKDLYFEDFRPGDTGTFGALTLTREALVEFAREFDPQPFHVDEEQARQSFVGRLIASGWHTCALQMRILCDAWVLRSSSLGGPGVDEIKWLKPVLPGDTLSVRQTVLDTRPSRSRPEIGLVHLLLETLNATGETVMTQTMWIMFGRRDAESGQGPGAVQVRAGRHADPGLPPAGPEAGTPPPVRSFDDLVVGQRDELGSYHFTADEIIRFAQAFDPQPFHVSAEAGRATHFGGLAASGWHTAARWMRSLVDYRRSMIVQAQAAGEPPPRFGSSPGFKNLRWLEPVRPGDVLSFATTLTSKRESASRPGWGLAFSHNTAHNQHGRLVYAFDGSGFWGRRLSGP